MDHDADVFGKMRQLVERLAPAPVCETCLAERVEAAREDRVQTGFNELAGMREFEASRGLCSLCEAEQHVIRRRK